MSMDAAGYVPLRWDEMVGVLVSVLRDRYGVGKGGSKYE